MRYSSWIHREVSEKDAKDYADSIHAIFVETSAKNAININEVFIEISESVSWTCSTFGFSCLRICVHDVTQLSNIFQHQNKLEKKLTMAESLFMSEGNEARAVYILSPNVFFQSSRFIISLLLPKQPWPIKVCWSCAAISSSKDALLASMKWCCCYLPD